MRDHLVWRRERGTSCPVLVLEDSRDFSYYVSLPPSFRLPPPPACRQSLTNSCFSLCFPIRRGSHSSPHVNAQQRQAQCRRVGDGGNARRIFSGRACASRLPNHDLRPTSFSLSPRAPAPHTTKPLLRACRVCLCFFGSRPAPPLPPPQADPLGYMNKDQLNKFRTAW